VGGFPGEGVAGTRFKLGLAPSSSQPPPSPKSRRRRRSGDSESCPLPAARPSTWKQIKGKHSFTLAGTNHLEQSPAPTSICNLTVPLFQSVHSVCAPLRPQCFSPAQTAPCDMCPGPGQQTPPQAQPLHTRCLPSTQAVRRRPKATGSPRNNSITENHFFSKTVTRANPRAWRAQEGPQTHPPRRAPET
jgi:hypothetical protein